MPDPTVPQSLTEGAAERQMARLTRRSFVTGAVAGLAGFGAWHWLRTAGPEDGLPWPLRRVLGFNRAVAESLGAPHRLAPTFPADSARGLARTNGLVGLEDEIDAANWQLRVQHDGGPAQRMIGLRALQDLPQVDLVTELKCVEGWSQVIHFSGVRFLDFATRFGLATRSGRPPDLVSNSQDLYRYVYLATPDEEYYVGLDIASALHPQTLLCDTMNGQPLNRQHGAPLRLYLPVKYGYKSLKRIGLIRFQDDRPRDYWADRGYDWYAGH